MRPLDIRGGTNRLAGGVVEARLGLERRRQETGLGYVAIWVRGEGGLRKRSGGPRR